jgi:hypothetical protein
MRMVAWGAFQLAVMFFLARMNGAALTQNWFSCRKAFVSGRSHGSVIDRQEVKTLGLYMVQSH